MSFVDELLAKAKALFQRPAPTAPPPEDYAEPTPRVEASPPSVSFHEVAAPPRVEPGVAPAPEPAPTIIATAEAQEEPEAEAAESVVDREPVATASPAAESPTAEEAAAPSAPAGGLVLRLAGDRPEGQTFEVTRAGATIGRGSENTIQLSDLSVSRKHARIAFRQGGYWLSDVGSMGGTWVDGAKLAAPRRLAQGQTIDIGVCRLTVAVVEAVEKPARAKGRSNGT